VDVDDDIVVDWTRLVMVYPVCVCITIVCCFKSILLACIDYLDYIKIYVTLPRFGPSYLTKYQRNLLDLSHLSERSVLMILVI
jgi:hypothetical protein